MPGTLGRSEFADPVEALLDPLLDLPAAEQAERLRALCSAHPDLAAALRARFAAFQTLLALPGAAGGAPGRMGDYELLKPIGAGGMGEVWLARQHLGGATRLVALKRIHPTASFAPVARARFRVEAAAAMRVDHPGLCPVLDAGEVDGVPFLVMRLIPGQTLAQHLDVARECGTGLELPQRGPALASRLDRILRLLEDAARAVHAAHQAGLVHRDIKPGNLMVTPEGHPVLLDFGLARDLDPTGPGLTHTGHAPGTPAYMAPEQIEPRGRQPGRSTDVYALGATLFECLTLRPPFLETNVEALYRQVLTEVAPRVRRLQADLPRDLDVVVETALRKEPERRYATALALADDLRRVREHLPIAARPTGPVVRTSLWVRRNRAVAAVLVLLVLALAALGWQMRILVLQAEARDQARARTDQVLAELVETARTRLLDVPGTAALRQELLQRAASTYAEVAAERGDEPALRQRQAQAHLSAGRNFLDLGQMEAVGRHLTLARSGLAAHFLETGDRTSLRQQGDATRLLALVAKDADRPEQALALAQEADALYQRAAADQPVTAETRLQRVDALLCRAAVAMDQVAVAEVEAATTQAVELCAPLNATHVEARTQTARAQSLRAYARLRTGGVTAALPDLEAAVAGFRNSLAETPGARSLRDDLVAALNTLEAVRQALPGQAPASLLPEAVKIAESLVRDFGEVVHYRRKLAQALLNLAQSQASDRDAARQLLARAETALAGHERDTAALRVLVNVWRAASSLALAANDAETARQELERAAAALEARLPQCQDWTLQQTTVEVGHELFQLSRLWPERTAAAVARVQGWIPHLTRTAQAPVAERGALAHLWRQLGEHALEQADLPAAHGLLAEGLRVATAAPQADPECILHLTASLAATQDGATALATARRALTETPAALLAAHPGPHAGLCATVAAHSEASGDHTAAGAAWREALAALREAFARDRSDALRVELAFTQAHLACAAQRGGNPAEAATLAAAALRAVRALADQPLAPRPHQRLALACARLLQLPDAALGEAAAATRAELGSLATTR